MIYAYMYICIICIYVYMYRPRQRQREKLRELGLLGFGGDEISKPTHGFQTVLSSAAQTRNSCAVWAQEVSTMRGLSGIERVLFNHGMVSARLCSHGLLNYRSVL